MKVMTGLAVVAAVLVLVSCAPADSPSPEERSPEGLENGSFKAELNSFDIHYEVHGRGPVLMTLPNSWGLSLIGLRSLYRLLEEKLTMVYFDPRGMGESSPIVEESDMGMEAVRADFQALREHLGLESVSAIGWSNGAMNLMMLASERPETIDSAIFLHGAAYFSEEDSAAYAEQYPEVLEAWGALLEEMQNQDLTDDQRTKEMKAMWLGKWFPISFADQSKAPKVLDRTFRDAEFSWTHASYSQRDQADFDARDLLPRITARSLVITGAHDALPVSKGEEMAAGISNAEFVIFEQSGHYAPIEEPDAFVGLVFRFLGVN
jgi:proline iminopeptidase